jgi:hypothetical protein
MVDQRSVDFLEWILHSKNPAGFLLYTLGNTMESNMDLKLDYPLFRSSGDSLGKVPKLNGRIFHETGGQQVLSNHSSSAEIPSHLPPIQRQVHLVNGNVTSTGRSLNPSLKKCWGKYEFKCGRKGRSSLATNLKSK